MASSLYVEKQGGQLGPFTGAQLRELAGTGRLEPADRVRRADQPKVVTEGEILGLFYATEGQEGTDALQTGPAGAKREMPSGSEKPPAFPPEDGVGEAVASGGKRSLGTDFLVAIVFTLIGVWLMTFGGSPVLGVITILLFGGGGVLMHLISLGVGRGGIAGAPKIAPPPAEISPVSKAEQVDRESPVVPPLSGATAWLSKVSPRELGLSAVAFMGVGLFLQFFTISDARPFASPLFWYWGLCCLVLHVLIHRHAGTTPLGLALACVLRSIVFFVAGFFGGVVLGCFLSFFGLSTIESCFPLAFVLTSLPTLLIPNRLDALLMAVQHSMFAAGQLTKSRSAGLCHRCRGTGYCHVCRSQGVHLGGQCLDCLASGGCGECSGTGGRSVL